MTVDVEKFVLLHAPQTPARILEVGCGAGELARALARRGYEITAIDPEAPDGPIFHRVSLEGFSEGEPFAAVVANRSLHHVEDLGRGVNKIHELLRPGGLLILNEFGWDQMDEATAQWYLSHVADPRPEDESLLPENFPHAWIDGHEDLHTSKVMRDVLHTRFAVQTFEWVPYVAHHYLKRDDLIAEERNLIQSGRIKALGFRYVGRRE